MFRRVFAFDHIILRFALYILIGTALFLLTTTVVGATDTVSTPSASEYTRETTPVIERQPETSTAADLRLATGFSLATILLMATVVLSDRGATATDGEQAIPTHRHPATVRPIRSAESMPEAA